MRVKRIEKTFLVTLFPMADANSVKKAINHKQGVYADITGGKDQHIRVKIYATSENDLDQQKIAIRKVPGVFDLTEPTVIHTSRRPNLKDILVQIGAVLRRIKR